MPRKPNKQTEYKCSKCGSVFKLKKKITKTPRCSRCIYEDSKPKTRAAKYHLKDKYKEYRHVYYLKTKHGISKEEYEKMLEQQDGVCFICRNPDSRNHKLCVDHNHITNEVRGLLCHNCNRTLGVLKDDPYLFRSCISYLESRNTIFDNYTPPSWDIWFMKHVYLTAEKSKDPSSKIGAVMVRDKRIISSGFNGFPTGVKDLPERYNDRETKYAMVVHAEENACLTAARFGIVTCGSSLYTQAIPCNECSKAIIQCEIKEIIIHRRWPSMIKKWTESAEISKIMLEEAGINIRYVDGLLDMIGYLDGKIVKV